MTALLASVRSYDEAYDAAQAGADLIDLKEPSHGALGAVDAGTIARVVAELRAHWPLKPISAAIGDLPADALGSIAAQVLALADTGVDYVKAGIAPGPAGVACLRHLADLPAPVVPVLLCDDGLDPACIDAAAHLGFVGVMFDTARKDGRTLFDCVDTDSLGEALALIGMHGTLTGVAGSLGMPQLPAIRALAPDFAGFRGALCSGARTARLDPERVRSVAAALHEATTAGPVPYIR